MKNFVLPLVITAILIIVIFVIFGSFENSISIYLEELKTNPQQYAVYSLLVLTSDIVLPVPSSIVMYLNGFVLGTAAGTALSFGSLMVSSLIGYYLGKAFGIKRNSEAHDKSKSLLHTYGPIIVLVTRGIPILSESVCFVCGYNNMPLPRYLMLNAIGFFPICVLYAYLGEAGGSQDSFLLALSVSVCITALFFVSGKLLQNRKTLA
ncbi:MAG: VTT domain-containing protein [Ignavibacteria bacterium]|nr:VTT domain-containing protein [Ignavibacteria bacterium]